MGAVQGHSYTRAHGDYMCFLSQDEVSRLKLRAVFPLSFLVLVKKKKKKTKKNRKPNTLILRRSYIYIEPGAALFLAFLSHRHLAIDSLFLPSSLTARIWNETFRGRGNIRSLRGGILRDASPDVRGNRNTSSDWGKSTRSAGISESRLALSHNRSVSFPFLFSAALSLLCTHFVA